MAFPISKKNLEELKPMSEVKNYIIVGKDGTEGGVFTGRQPRQAALKAANAGKGTKDKPETIRLRERGTKKIHIFTGYNAVVAAPEKRPAWMKAQIKKPFVEKVGIEKPGKVAKAKIPKAAATAPATK